LSASLSLPLGSKIFLELACANLVFFDLLAAEALDLLEELGHFVGHCWLQVPGHGTAWPDVLVVQWPG